jgi:hypothetical protein
MVLVYYSTNYYNFVNKMKRKFENEHVILKKSKINENDVNIVYENEVFY